ncbi:methyltransferase domain-containing protein, partial [Zopfochytrium polystomum]
IASLAQCLATTTQFDASERCWTVHKQALASAVIAEIEAMPFASRQAFNTLDDWSPHRLILPTHNCNMLKLQRMGAGYSQGHGQIHYDGPKWFCPEFLETPDKAAITPLVPATPERAAEVSAAAAAMATVAPPPCTIFSLGSNGDFSFEQSMRAFVGSACAIHTFDCTGVWSDPSTIFHPWCVSAKTFVSPQNRQYYRIQDLMTKLAITSVELLKIDVEGYEFETLEALALAPVHLLPKQILIEVHFWTAEDMTQFNLGGKMDVVDYSKENWSDRAVRFQKLIASMGYHVAVRELNPLHGCCAEYVLVRV